MACNENFLQVTFVNDNNVRMIGSSPNEDILSSSFGQGILNVKFKKEQDTGLFTPTLPPLPEDLVDQDSEVFFKPTTLLDENYEGRELFGFSTPNKRDSLVNLLRKCNLSSPVTLRTKRSGSTTPTTPKSPKTPRSLHGTPKIAKSLPQTPRTPRSLHGTPRTPRSLHGTPRTPRSLHGTPRTPRSLHGTPSTPRSSQTQRSKDSRVTPKSSSKRRQVQSTPYSFRRRVTQRISDIVSESESSYSDDDYDSDMDGNYAPSDSDESDLEGDQTDKENKSLVRSSLSRTPVRTPRRGREPKVNIDKVATSDDYFVNSDSKICTTSEHTLNRLETPRLALDVLKALMENVPSSHVKEKEELLEDHTGLFPHWMILLCEGFSIFLCGVGSKKMLLCRFKEEYLHHVDHLVINGFFPSLSLKSILLGIVEDILGLATHPQGINELLHIIQDQYCRSDSEPLFLVVNNLDGPMLRVEKTQLCLAKLASMPKIHMIASLDHINSPLLFDSNKLSLYNPLWFDATTLANYMEETSYENSLLVQQTGAMALSSLIHVFMSLTPNAKGIFIILARYQLDQKDTSGYAGMSFNVLYQKCRESFFVNSDLALRAQLTEFKDHKLIKTKKGFDGGESLIIPLQSVTLQEFIEQHSDASL